MVKLDNTGLMELLATSSMLVNVFIVSFLSNAVPYMTVPYLALIAGYGATVDDPLDKATLVLVSGVGAGLGKVVVFLVGRGARVLVSKERRRMMELAARLARRSVFLAVFLFAALPLPDDILYLPLGLMGYSLTLFTIAVVAGKIVITGAAVLLGSSVSVLLGSGNTLVAAVAAAAIGILLSVLVARMDWVRVIESYEKDGVAAAFQTLIEEVLRALKPRRKLG